MKIAIPVFALLVGVLYAAHVFSDRHDILNRDNIRICPHALHAIQHPPPVAPDAPYMELRDAKVKAIVDRMNREYPLRTTAYNRSPVIL